MFRKLLCLITFCGLMLLQFDASAHYPTHYPGRYYPHRPRCVEPPTRHGYHGVRRGYHHHDPYKVYAELYPKYYGGFHARHFQSYGVPPGDVGLRGNGIQWFAW